MRMSRLFSQTLRDAPAEAETEGHKLLLRAGYIRPLAAGIFSLLPLGQRAVDNISAIIREEMDAIGGQEITMPVVHPADLWKETGRWMAIGPELTRFKDRADRDMVLAMTHEEVIADLVRKEIRSYRQLPALLYQLQTKWRDEPRPRAGLIRVREFVMKDSYSLDADEAGLDAQYRAHYAAYFRIYARCGLPVIAVESDMGMMGGSQAHEYMYLTPIGEDTLMLCDECGYAANREVAAIAKSLNSDDTPLPLEKVATPDAKTIEALAAFLRIDPAQTAKAFFQVATFADGREQFVLAIARGDHEINEVKLANAVKAKALRPATEAEISAAGAVAGYGSAVGVSTSALVVVDDAVAGSRNLVAGANEAGYHLLNTNYGRDYTAQIVADIAGAREGDPCSVCAAPLRAARGVEVGNIFKLGTRYTAALGATYQDEVGESRPVVMGSYGIGVGRLLACIAEQHRDAAGLKWPISVAPFAVHLVTLPGAEWAADAIYAELTEAKISALYDDRDERAGVKFNDADLLGMPLRITVSPRTLAINSAEFKPRDAEAKLEIPLTDLLLRVQTEIAVQTARLNADAARFSPPAE
jgi:prolyl-tRNA synthetase